MTDLRPEWFDSHCHLEAGESLVDVLTEAAAAGVTNVVTVGTDAASSQGAIDLAARHEGVWATVGIHPHDASSARVEDLVGLLDAPGVVAVGECGLDYHYLHSPAEVQRAVFAAQIQLARNHGLPLVIHTREAWDDTFSILEAEGPPGMMIFHCFTGGVDEARRCLDLGAWLSFSGIVTFPNAAQVREAAQWCPLDRMLIETDAPYLAPVPHRGRPNRPALVARVGEAIAELTGHPRAIVAQQTTTNARTAFGLIS